MTHPSPLQDKLTQRNTYKFDSLFVTHDAMQLDDVIHDAMQLDDVAHDAMQLDDVTETVFVVQREVDDKIILCSGNTKGDQI